MPFGKSDFDKLGEELGLTPQQIREAISSGKTSVEKLTQMQSELESTKNQLTERTNEYTATKTKLDELEASPRRGEVVQQPQQPQYASFLDDENTAFSQRFNTAAQPLARVALEAAANTAKMSARMMLAGQVIETLGGMIDLSKLWDRWLGEIDANAKDVTLNNLGNPTTWLNIFDYVKGKHMKEMMATPQNFVETVQTSTNVVVGDKTRPEKLNDEENRVATRMAKEVSGRLTPEKYQEIKKKMTFLGA